MKARCLIYSLCVLGTLVFSACERDEIDLRDNGNETMLQQLVGVPCRFEVTPFGLVPGDTSAVKSEDYSDAEMQIKDFWLVQFDGSGNLLASVYHKPDLISNYVQMDNTDGNIAKTKTVWIVANTGDDSGMSTANLEKQLAASRGEMGAEFSSSTDLQIFELDGYRFTTHSESSLASLNRADGAILMSGKSSFDAADLYDPYPDGTPDYDVTRNGLEVTLSSMVAKLTINYNSVDGYTLNTIKLFRVPDRASFNGNLPDNRATVTNYRLLPYEYTIPKESYNGSIVVYVPQNIRPDSEHPVNGGAKTKTNNAPPKATYISFGLTRAADGVPVNVNVFPGGDQDSDPEDSVPDGGAIDAGKDNAYGCYKILANAHYTEKVTINPSSLDKYISDELADSRVIEKIRQTITSNCYILNPLTSVKNAYFNYASMREEYYSLPVVARVNEAWTGQNSNNLLGADDEWKMEVIWQDVPGRQVFFSESSGLKAWKNAYGTLVNNGNDVANNVSYAPEYYGKGNGENGFVNVYVKKESQSERTEGNVLIGLRKKTGEDANGNNEYGPVIWSWHLWVTDYNPDAAGGWSSNSGFSSNVNGDTNDDGVSDAKVFHYKFWTTGNGYDYEWIMDRHLGALGWRPAGMFGLSANSTEHEAYGLYYQWGRKDPFPAQRLLNNMYYKNQNTSPSGYSNYNVSEIVLYDISGEVNSGISIKGSSGLPADNNIYTTALAPTQLYNVQDITIYDGQRWNHPSGKEWPSGTPDQDIVGLYSTVQGTKTLFDPCPAGWELPDVNAYLGSSSANGFVYSTSSNKSENINGRFATIFHEVENKSETSADNEQYEVNNGAWEIRADGSGNSSSSFERGCSHAMGSQNANSTYFPCSGWLQSGGNKDMQGIGDVWCANEKDGRLGSFLYIGRGVGNSFESTGRVISINNTITSGGQDIAFSKNNGFSVRCVKK